MGIRQIISDAFTRKTIGVFSKFDISGGSEMRCVELANAIYRHTKHKAYLLCEGGIPSRLQERVMPGVDVWPHVFRPEPINMDKLYELDCLIVINTDSKNFTTAKYWMGKTEKHNSFVDLTRMKQMVFLFNYLISPSRHLPEIEAYCPNIKILTTNTKFFQEIPRKIPQAMYFPRMILESPIDPDSVAPHKTPSDRIRIGSLSKPLQDKWNVDWKSLIELINQSLGQDAVEWRFLGMHKTLKEALKDIKNVECYKEFSLSVKDFLKNLDVFIFFPSYRREEPWSRSVAEALMSGCPVITTNKGGNVDQIIHGNNGFLCETLEDIVKCTEIICGNKRLWEQMSKMALKNAQNFSSAIIANKLLNFIEVT